MAGRPKKSQTERDNKPRVTDMVTILYKELMSSIKADEIVNVKLIANRNKQIGLLTTLMCESIEKSSIYYTNGSGHIFDGRMYYPFRSEDLSVAVRKIVENKKWNFDESMRRNGIIQDICSSLKSLIRTRRLELDRDLIAFRNGVLNLNTLEFFEHTKRVAPFCFIDIDYDPSEECWKWKSFLEEVLPVEEKRLLVQEFLGAAFIDRRKVKIEAMMILYGAGSNGKSVIAHTIANILGEHNVTHFSFDDLLYSQDQSKNTDKLNNKLINYSEEVGAVNSSKFGDRLKALISGDPLMCRPIYGETYTTESIPMLMANANKLPRLDDASHGLLRRMIIIEFDRIIPTCMQDHLLESKLALESSGIFNWILEGRSRLMANNGTFTNGKSIERAAESFMAANNSVLEFMFERNLYPIPETPEEAITPCQHRLAGLFSEYDQWCIQHRYRPVNNNDFRLALESAGYYKHRKPVGIVFDCYGHESTIEAKKKMKEEQDALENGTNKKKRNSVPIVLQDGRIVTRGDYNASKFSHLSRSWVSSMRMAGKLFEAIIPAKELGVKEDPLSLFYDIEKLVQIAKKHRAYLSQERQDAFDKEMVRDTSLMLSFNKQMRDLKKPFRKTCLGLTMTQMFIYGSVDDYIIVEPDWEYNEEEAKELIREFEKERMSKFK